MCLCVSEPLRSVARGKAKRIFSFSSFFFLLFSAHYTLLYLTTHGLALQKKANSAFFSVYW